MNLAEELQQLPYQELKKRAKKLGVKTNVKAEKLITAIISANEEQVMFPNGCNEIDESESMSDDSEIHLKTPEPSSFKREGTFCIEHETELEDDVSLPQPVFTPAKTPRKSILRRSPRTSAKKNDVSSKRSNRVNFITPERNLTRKSTSASVTPLRSVKDRPKTPIAKGIPGKRKRSISPFTEKSPKILKGVDGRTSRKSSNAKTPDNKVCFAVGTKFDKGMQTTPGMMSEEKKPVARSTRFLRDKKEATTPSRNASIKNPNFKEIHQKAFDKLETVQEYHQRKQQRFHDLTKSQTKARSGTPASAKKQNSAIKGTQESTKKTPLKSVPKNSHPTPSTKPSRIPQPFGGIPFIPSVKSLRKINMNFAAQNPNTQQSASNNKVAKENENPGKHCQRNLFSAGPNTKVFHFAKAEPTGNASMIVHQNKKFNLMASLSKKLPYKPYKGTLKPLTDSSGQNQASTPSVDPIKWTREKHREILKGVRTNRRFDLQMSRRGIKE